MTAKSEWGTPKLIVLGRGTPEENVLMGCKNSGGAGNPHANCKYIRDLVPCKSTSGS